jgi:hypothetical protein
MSTLVNSINSTASVFDVSVGDLTVANLGGTYGGVVLATASTGVIAHVENSTTAGQLLISKADGSNPIWASITPGTGISVTPGSNSITIAATTAMSWSAKTTSFSMVALNGYIANHASVLVVATLPSTATVGDIFEITNIGVAGFKVAQNALQYIYFGLNKTTIGTGGSLSSSNLGDSLRFICTVTDVGFQMLSAIGNIALV